MLPILAVLVGLFILLAWSHIRLLQSGAPVQGTIVDAQSIGCGKFRGVNYAVQFTDRAGQIHTATFDTCQFSAPSNMSRGDSITIVYLPDNPTMIAPRDGVGGGPLLLPVGAAICLGCPTLLGLTIWIAVLGAWIRRKRAAARFRRAPDMENQLATRRRGVDLFR
jgi:Protein of unknown function (DUF3592)